MRFSLSLIASALLVASEPQSDHSVTNTDYVTFWNQYFNSIDDDLNHALPISENSCNTPYTVKAGDTCFKIANTHRMTLQNLILRNPTVGDCSYIVPGQVLCLSDLYVPCKNSYVVKAGDTCNKIAIEKGISLDALIKSNPIARDCSNIVPGQVLCLPNSQNSCNTPYTVKAGDTCFKIANTHRMTLQNLILRNPTVGDCSYIVPGQVLCLSDLYVPCKNSYVVKAGDTCNKIAIEKGISLDALIKSNPIARDCSNIVPGQVLCLPNSQNSCNTPYTVKAGDTCFKIANTHRMTLQNLILRNPTVGDCSYIVPGQVLCLSDCHIQCENSYVVKAGDTCNKIAIEKGISLDALIKSNPFVGDCSKIVPGQVLCFAQDLPTFECSENYEVKSGDTLARIAERESLTTVELIAANPLIRNGALIYPGQLLCIPPCHVKCERPYTVKSGDTSFSIAVSNNVDYLKLQSLNPSIKDFTRIYPGQIVCLPFCFETCANSYIVQIGDTCEKISILKSVSVASLINANPNTKSCSFLYNGQMLCIPPPKCENSYEVKYGDKISTIANTQHVSMWDILALNPSLKRTAITPGQVLCLPSNKKCSNNKIIRSGETCRKIANDNNISVNQLLEANANYGYLNCSDLHVGEVICLPSVPSCATNYRVVRGDSCYAIAEANGITLPQLINLNPGVGNCTLIYPGQTLCISQNNIAPQYYDVSNEIFINAVKDVVKTILQPFVESKDRDCQVVAPRAVCNDSYVAPVAVTTTRRKRCAEETVAAPAQAPSPYLTPTPTPTATQIYAPVSNAPVTTSSVLAISSRTTTSSVEAQQSNSQYNSLSVSDSRMNMPSYLAYLIFAVMVML